MVCILQIRIKDYERFDFPGSQELAAMFDFYRSGQIVRDIRLTKRLNSNLRSFDKWVDYEAEAIENSIKEGDKELEQAKEALKNENKKKAEITGKKK